METQTCLSLYMRNGRIHYVPVERLFNDMSTAFCIVGIGLFFIVPLLSGLKEILVIPLGLLGLFGIFIIFRLPFLPFLLIRNKKDNLILLRRKQEFESARLHAKSARQYFLLLRPFVLDKILVKKMNYVLDPYKIDVANSAPFTFEECIMECCPCKDVIRISSDIDSVSKSISLGPYGDKDWLEKLVGLADNATGILVVPGIGQGLVSEMEMIMDKKMLNKTIIIMLPRLEYQYDFEKDWAKFSQSRILKKLGTCPINSQTRFAALALISVLVPIRLAQLHTTIL